MDPNQPASLRPQHTNAPHLQPYWQFNPLSIDLEYTDGTVTNLCNTTAAGGLAALGACTAIADTKSPNNHVGDDTSRTLLAAATNVWAASNGSTASNWLTALGGGATAVVTVEAPVALRLREPPVNVKGVGEMVTYWVEEARGEAAGR